MLQAFLARSQDGLNGLCCAYRNGALFDDDFGRVCCFGDGARHGLDESQIRRLVRPDPKGLGRCVHTHKDDVCCMDARLDLGGEE